MTESKRKAITRLEKEYNHLEQYVLDNEGNKDCSTEVKRMGNIMNTIGRIANN